MASGRILKTQISLSERVNELPIHAALLFTWMIPHADDFGRMRGSARIIKAMVVPMRDDMLATDVDKCLNQMAESGLIERYQVDGETYIPIPKSISYAKADEANFRTFHDQMVSFLRGDHAAHYLWPHLDHESAHAMMNGCLEGFNE